MSLTQSNWLGEAKQVGSLAVVPILSTKPLSEDKFITLSEATKQNLVEIIELPGQESVNSLMVKNLADLTLLLFAGELLLGGKQDRIVAKDTIVPPRTTMPVPVFCVERGRWGGTRPSFDLAGTLVNQHVRETAYLNASQDRVWVMVAESNSQVGVRSSTGTIQAILKDPKIAEKVEKTAKLLKKAFKSVPNAVGVVCWLNGKVHSADLFANAELFDLSKDNVLKSYAIDAQMVGNAENTPVDIEACRAFLTAIMQAKREAEEQGPLGATYKIREKRVVGTEFGQAGFGGGLTGGFWHGWYKPGGEGNSFRPVAVGRGDRVNLVRRLLGGDQGASWVIDERFQNRRRTGVRRKG